MIGRGLLGRMTAIVNEVSQVDAVYLCWCVARQFFFFAIEMHYSDSYDLTLPALMFIFMSKLTINSLIHRLGRFHLLQRHYLMQFPCAAKRTYLLDKNNIAGPLKSNDNVPHSPRYHAIPLALTC